MRRALCAPKVYMSYERASWVNCGGFGATRGVSRGARIRDCTMMGRRATLVAAARSLGPQKYRRTGWVDYGGVEARRAGEPNYDN